MKRLRFALLLLIASLPQQPARAGEPLQELLSYCSVREATTRLMVKGRDDGVAKEQVLAKLPPASTDAELATRSRLDDVYGLPNLNGDTLVAFRLSSCMMQGMLGGNEPRFGAQLGSALQGCQERPLPDLQTCVFRAAKASLVPAKP